MASFTGALREEGLVSWVEASRGSDDALADTEESFISNDIGLKDDLLSWDDAFRREDDFLFGGDALRSLEAGLAVFCKADFSDDRLPC